MLPIGESERHFIDGLIILDGCGNDFYSPNIPTILIPAGLPLDHSS